MDSEALVPPFAGPNAAALIPTLFSYSLARPTALSFAKLPNLAVRQLMAIERSQWAHAECLLRPVISTATQDAHAHQPLSTSATAWAKA